MRFQLDGVVEDGSEIVKPQLEVDWIQGEKDDINLRTIPILTHTDN